MGKGAAREAAGQVCVPAGWGRSPGRMGGRWGVPTGLWGQASHACRGPMGRGQGGQRREAPGCAPSEVGGDREGQSVRSQGAGGQGGCQLAPQPRGGTRGGRSGSLQGQCAGSWLLEAGAGHAGAVGRWVGAQATGSGSGRAAWLCHPRACSREQGTERQSCGLRPRLRGLAPCRRHLESPRRSPRNASPFSVFGGSVQPRRRRRRLQGGWAAVCCPGGPSGALLLCPGHGLVLWVVGGK